MKHKGITAHDCVRVEIDRQDFITAIKRAQDILGKLEDRRDLHSRDDFERFINNLMGVIAEKMVWKWLKAQGLQVEEPKTLDYDLIVISASGNRYSLSVKSSLSVYKALEEILETFTIAITPEEASKADIHVQVYFWLKLKDKPRTVVPSLTNTAIIGWCTPKYLEELNVTFNSYRTEERKAPDIKLSQLLPMAFLAEKLRNS